MTRIVLWTLVVLFVLITVYVVGGRKKLKDMADAGNVRLQRFFAFWEPWEILLYRKSETLLYARFKMLIGGVLTILLQVQDLDLSPVLYFLPDQHRAWVEFGIRCLPLLITVFGAADERLRRDTTKPLELVAIREEDVPADVRAKIIAAEKAKEAAVAEVVEAKVEGKVQP